MRPFPALLLAAACATGYGSEPRLLRLSSAAEAATHTTPWADSTRLGDTTFYSKGRVITTVAVIIDSIWPARPPVHPSAGLPSGPFNLPPDSLCTLGYTGTTLLVTGARTLRDLQRVRECGAQAFAQIRVGKLKDAAGHLSVETARIELDTWPWSGLCGRVRDSTILAFYIGDDVLSDEWGPAPLATRLARWDSIAGLVRARCPEAAVAIRAMPTQLEARPRWQWLTTAWAQYPGPRPVWGAPEPFFANQVASARRQGLGLVAGLNLLNGSCGPASRRWCLPDVPGSTLPGTQPELYQLSVAELMYYKTVALSDPYVCASVDWSWGPNFKSDFHQRPEIRSAMKALGLIARTRPRSSCSQR